jgi:hypothetical protein
MARFLNLVLDFLQMSPHISKTDTDAGVRLGGSFSKNFIGSMDAPTVAIITAVVSLVFSVANGLFILIQHCLPERPSKFLSRCCNSAVSVE